MWNKKTFTVLCSLALAGSMAVPRSQPEGICGQEALIAAPYCIGCGGEADRDCG